MHPNLLGRVVLVWVLLPRRDGVHGNRLRCPKRLEPLQLIAILRIGASLAFALCISLGGFQLVFLIRLEVLQLAAERRLHGSSKAFWSRLREPEVDGARPLPAALLERGDGFDRLFPRGPELSEASELFPERLAVLREVSSGLHLGAVLRRALGWVRYGISSDGADLLPHSDQRGGAPEGERRLHVPIPCAGGHPLAASLRLGLENGDLRLVDDSGIRAGEAHRICLLQVVRILPSLIHHRLQRIALLLALGAPMRRAPVRAALPRDWRDGLEGRVGAQRGEIALSRSARVEDLHFLLLLGIVQVGGPVRCLLLVVAFALAHFLAARDKRASVPFARPPRSTALAKLRELPPLVSQASLDRPRLPAGPVSLLLRVPRVQALCPEMRHLGDAQIPLRIGAASDVGGIAQQEDDQQQRKARHGGETHCGLEVDEHAARSLPELLRFLSSRRRSLVGRRRYGHVPDLEAAEGLAGSHFGEVEHRRSKVVRLRHDAPDLVRVAEGTRHRGVVGECRSQVSFRGNSRGRVHVHVGLHRGQVLQGGLHSLAKSGRQAIRGKRVTKETGDGHSIQRGEGGAWRRSAGGEERRAGHWGIGRRRPQRIGSGQVSRHDQRVVPLATALHRRRRDEDVVPLSRRRVEVDLLDVVDPVRLAEAVGVVHPGAATRPVLLDADVQVVAVEAREGLAALIPRNRRRQRDRAAQGDHHFEGLDLAFGDAPPVLDEQAQASEREHSVQLHAPVALDVVRWGAKGGQLAGAALEEHARSQELGSAALRAEGVESPTEVLPNQRCSARDHGSCHGRPGRRVDGAGRAKRVRGRGANNESRSEHVRLDAAIAARGRVVVVGTAPTAAEVRDAIDGLCVGTVAGVGGAHGEDVLGNGRAEERAVPGVDAARQALATVAGGVQNQERVVIEHELVERPGPGVVDGIRRRAPAVRVEASACLIEGRLEDVNDVGRRPDGVARGLRGPLILKVEEGRLRTEGDPVVSGLPRARSLNRTQGRARHVGTVAVVDVLVIAPDRRGGLRDGDWPLLGVPHEARVLIEARVAHADDFALPEELLFPDGKEVVHARLDHKVRLAVEGRLPLQLLDVHSAGSVREDCDGDDATHLGEHLRDVVKREQGLRCDLRRGRGMHMQPWRSEQGMLPPPPDLDFTDAAEMVVVAKVASQGRQDGQCQPEDLRGSFRGAPRRGQRLFDQLGISQRPLHSLLQHRQSVVLDRQHGVQDQRHGKGVVRRHRFRSSPICLSFVGQFLLHHFLKDDATRFVDRLVPVLQHGEDGAMHLVAEGRDHVLVGCNLVPRELKEAREARISLLEKR
eukprot:scaffold3622_cov250-Pinguiococcus_pyrenoidosus.AAC.2